MSPLFDDWDEVDMKELNGGGEPVKNATYWKRQHDKLADRIAELENQNKELHAIAQRIAMAESDARKSLQSYKDAQTKQGKPVGWFKKSSYGLWEECWDGSLNKDGIPLYTTPQTKDKE